MEDTEKQEAQSNICFTCDEIEISLQLEPNLTGLWRVKV